jgi:hypothetical protein
VSNKFSTFQLATTIVSGTVEPPPMGTSFAVEQATAHKTNTHPATFVNFI